VLHTVDGIRRLDKKEQFGFLDGASQPLVEGTRESEDNFDPNSPTRAIRAGEFVLGYYNEYGVIPPSPIVPANPQSAKLPEVTGQSNMRDFGKNGTYLVCRKLYQDVAGFRKFLKDNSGGGGKEGSAEIEAFAAKLVGRWRSGTPISLSPERDEPAHSANDFAFGDDPHGLRCPIGSHIRRANPRDTFGLPEAHGTESFKTVNRHRILRRGMPYGPVLQGDRDDGEDRGLMFICVNADIAVQYEFVQRWMNDPSFNGLYQDQDVFSHTHNGTTANAVHDNPVRRRVIYTQNFITIKGGGYFFMPGMNALRYLAGG
jgi:Dyp-type peroxidase family